MDQPKEENDFESTLKKAPKYKSISRQKAISTASIREVV